MRLILLIICSTFSLNLFANDECITQDQAVELISEQFLDEYFGRVSTEVFNETFHFYFSEISLQEDVTGVIEMYLSSAYEFDGSQHVFVSDHTLSFDIDDEHVDFAEFTIQVNCEDNKIEASAFAGEYPNF